MIFKDKKVLIFDFDGTLIDSVPDLADALNAMLNRLQKEPFDEETIRHWVGNGAETLVKRALLGSSDITPFKDHELFKEALPIFLTYYTQKCADKTILYPNVRETLQSLKEMDYWLTIVTNKPYAFIEPILKQLSLDDLFCITLGGDSLDEKKPSAKPLLHICDKLHCSTKEAVMIGDSKNDIIAATQANIESIAVSYGYNYGEDIKSYKPTVVVDNFKDILSLLGKADAE